MEGAISERFRLRMEALPIVLVKYVESWRLLEGEKWYSELQGSIIASEKYEGILSEIYSSI